MPVDYFAPIDSDEAVFAASNDGYRRQRRVSELKLFGTGPAGHS